MIYILFSGFCIFLLRKKKMDCVTLLSANPCLVQRSNLDDLLNIHLLITRVIS